MVSGRYHRFVLHRPLRNGAAVNNRADGFRTLLLLSLLVCAGAGCGHATQPDCVAVPCPIPMAIMLSVTSQAGGSVPGLTVTISGSASGAAQCTAGASVTSCAVLGTAGTYNLFLSAAGFQDQSLSVVVPGSTPACGCPTVQALQVSAVLTPR